MTQSTDTTSMQEQIEEAVQQLNQVTRKHWHHGAGEIVDWNEYYSEVQDLFREALSTIASKSAESRDKKIISMIMNAYKYIDKPDMRAVYQEVVEMITGKEFESTPKQHTTKGGKS